MAQQRAAGQPAARRQAAKSGLPIWAKMLLLIFAAPLIAVLLPTCMLLTLGLMPTAAVYLNDRTNDKSFTITVGLTNLCGVLPTIGDLWDRGQVIQVATDSLVDPLFWLLSMGGAAIGWLIFMGMPPLVAAYYSFASQSRIDAVLARQQALVEIWGEEVRGDDEEAEGEAARADTRAR